jgi:hypothetical protein
MERDMGKKAPGQGGHAKILDNQGVHFGLGCAIKAFSQGAKLRLPNQGVKGEVDGSARDKGVGVTHKAGKVGGSEINCFRPGGKLL